MFGHIHLHLSWKDIDGQSASALKGKINNYTETDTKGHSRKVITGKIKNLEVYTDKKGINIKGDLAEYLYGNKWDKSVDMHDVEKIIDDLTNSLELPIYNAKVKELSIVANMHLKQKPELYYPYLISHSSYAKTTTSTSKKVRFSLFDKKNNSLMFFNSSIQYRGIKEIIPKKYRINNLLRYEVKFTYDKTVKTSFIYGLYANNLHTVSIYTSLVNHWKNCYNQIEKDHSPTIKNIDAISTPSEATSFFVRSLLNDKEINRKYEIFMDSLSFNNVFTDSKNLTRAKLSEPKISPIFDGSNVLLDELSEIVADTAKDFISRA